MRKALRYAAAVVVLFFLLTGCTWQSDGVADEPGPAVQAEQAVPSEALPEELPAEIPEEVPEAPEPSETAAEAEPEEIAEEIRGLPPETTVYVSKRSNTIHSISDCCNMKHYREMTLADADANGYDYCLRCF